MANSFPQRQSPASVLLSDVPVRMAKADVRIADSAQVFTQLGACIEDVRRASGLTLEEFAHALGKDDRQVARWIKGEVRPQLETIFAVELFRGPLVIALARLSAGVEVVTEIRVRRQA